MSSTLYDMGDQYKGLFEVTNKISNSGKQDPVVPSPPLYSDSSRNSMKLTCDSTTPLSTGATT